MRLLEKILGHQLAIETLLSAVDENRLASTLIFAGVSGIGKRQVALGLAQALVCEKVPPVRGGCGVCGACLRIEKKQSESLLLVEASGVNIKIEQAREIVQFISLRKLGRARFVIIDEAHLLNPQAANSLLKSLEEPPSGTYFILLTSNPGAILPTIRSRGQQVRFQALNEKVLKSLTGAPHWILKASQGSVEVAHRLQEEEGDWQELRAAALGLFLEAPKSFPSEKLASLKELSKERQSAVFVAHCWQTYFRDLALKNAGEADLYNADFPDLFANAREIPMSHIHQMAEKAFLLEQDLLRNVDKSLAFENFWLDWSRGLRG